MKISLQLLIILGLLSSMALADEWTFPKGMPEQKVSQENLQKSQQIAQEFLDKNKEKDNWKGQNPRLGKSSILHNIHPAGVEYRVHCDNEENCGFIVVALDDWFPQDYTKKPGETYRFFISESETRNALDYDLEALRQGRNLPVPPSVHIEDMMIGSDGLSRGILKAAEKATQKWIDSNTGSEFGQWNTPKIGKRTVFPKVKGTDYQLIEYRVVCGEKTECGFVNVTVQRNGEVVVNSSSTSDRAPSSWLEEKPEDAPKGGSSGKLPAPRKGTKLPKTLSSNPSLGPSGNTYRQDFKSEAYCKITPGKYGSKVILSTLDNPNYEQNYFLQNGEFIAKNCFENITITLYLQNRGSLFALTTAKPTPFPACREEKMQLIGGGGFRTIASDFREPGNFITSTLAIDKNGYILPTWDTVEYETLPKIDISALPECESNVKVKK